jgi:pimeloyl-ACP methyl ester carboxylesterase
MLTIVKDAPASDDPSIHLDRTGPGPAEVLLLHGLGSRAADFSRLVSRFGNEPSVIAPDLRGHGASGASLPVTVEAFASDLLPLLDEEGPVVVVGFSFGCWVAMELWRARPEKVSALILVDPPLIYGPLFEWAAGPSGASRAEVIRKLTAIYRSSDLDEAVALMREHPLTGDLDETDLISNARSLMAADRPTLFAGLELTGHPEEQTRPSGSEVEPVVLFGETSPVTDRESAEGFALRIGGRTIPYPGGHAAHLEVPGFISAEIERSLSESS